jgi:hypothetical protein
MKHQTKIKLIIAGNQREYGSFILDQIRESEDYRIQPNTAMIDGVRYLYVFDVDSIRGFSDAEFIPYGTWYERKDIDRIKDEVKARLAAMGEPFPEWLSL